MIRLDVIFLHMFGPYKDIFTFFRGHLAYKHASEQKSSYSFFFLIKLFHLSLRLRFRAGLWCMYRINNCVIDSKTSVFVRVLFQTYDSVHEVLVSFGRRVLCYPLHRHFSLITAAVQDAARIFQGGEFPPFVSPGSRTLSQQSPWVVFRMAPEVKSRVETLTWPGFHTPESAFLSPFIPLCGPNKSWTALLSCWRRIWSTLWQEKTKNCCVPPPPPSFKTG